MNYVSGPACLYDAIFYAEIYFCRTMCTNTLSSITEDQEEMYSSYTDFFEKYKVIPDKSIYPFFYYNGKRPCPLSDFCDKNLSYFATSHTNIRAYLCSNPLDFQYFIISYYFEQIPNADMDKILDGDAEAIANGLMHLCKTYDLEDSYMETYTELFYHFENVVEELIRYLDNVMFYMVKYHKNRLADSHRTLQELFIDDIKVSQFKKAHSLEENLRLESQTYSICYMNPYITMYQGKENGYIFIFGNRMLDHIGGYVQYAYINPRRAMELLGHNYTMEILKVLDRGDTTVSQLSRIFNISRTSILRIVHSLEEELILTSYKEGWERYYRLNYDYLLYAKQKINLYLDKLIKIKHNKKDQRE